ncbi:hypothetical protein Gogos_010706 [Gossypium gossypioides]|uniref:Uncharacterized protein n=1 Tax=Gossypium gossypioides TaxID=34282 RepID=A0A7J9BMB5_GOSGO|nr:hypothetical protein [Gossypium gossypioides]
MVQELFRCFGTHIKIRVPKVDKPIY